MNPRTRFLLAQSTVMYIALILLVVFEWMTLELYFTVSFIAFLHLVDLTAPFAVAPQWRLRLRWLIATSIFVLGVIVLRAIYTISTV